MCSDIVQHALQLVDDPAVTLKNGANRSFLLYYNNNFVHQQRCLVLSASVAEIYLLGHLDLSRVVGFVE